MGRARVGQVYAEWHGDHWDIRFELPDGKPSKRACMPTPSRRPHETEATAKTRALSEAKHEARRLKALAWRGGWALAEGEKQSTEAKGETFDVYSDRWVKARRDPSETGNHIRKHIMPVLGFELALVNVTRADVERVVAHLDNEVRAGRLAWKSAQNIWGTLTKLFDDARNSKNLSLRALAGKPDPTHEVRGPDRGEQRQSAYLWPKEAAALLASPLPIRWRLTYAVALYTGLRQGELAALRVADVVLDGGYLSVHSARDRETGGIKSTKGKRARRVPIEPNLRPLLASLIEGKPGEALVLDMPPKQKMADELRLHLARAGLMRAELHANSAHQRPLTFHDLRHSFATWLALRGETELTIQSRLGHADAIMTQRYIAEAETVGNGDIGEPFGPLPSELIGGGNTPTGFPNRGDATTRNVGGVDGTRTTQITEDSCTSVPFRGRKPTNRYASQTDDHARHPPGLLGALSGAMVAASAEGRADVVGELAGIVARLVGEERAKALEVAGVAVLPVKRESR